ncbi:membrane associated rhomboid family serine protease [Saonia flava]|uniref:Membrane associated rhomboid family serine protease n=1 Tax=Saonia flava TaxID=523696 RepID=A0A846R1D1_9FLAO|nr:rhomboid family intramembrane serine protease [Saonia flava]NJB72762.1 membrane associated rhomboid family serine protease [Saonia flava]
MSDSNYFKFSNKVLVAPMLLVIFIWTIFLIEVRLGLNFNNHGIYPRTFSGLQGIVFSPFIHGSMEHLYNNTIPIAILTASLFYFYNKIALKVLLLGVLLSGLFTWFIGRPSYHIGISGLIYVLASFIFFKGIFTKHYRLIALSLFVVFIYGSLLWYIFPIKDGISWEGHLSGLITGLILAILIQTKIPILKKYKWEREDYNEEEDDFLKHFDENGNFIENKETPIEKPENISFKINYHYTNKEKGDNSLD